MARMAARSLLRPEAPSQEAAFPPPEAYWARPEAHWARPGAPRAPPDPEPAASPPERVAARVPVSVPAGRKGTPVVSPSAVSPSAVSPAAGVPPAATDRAARKAEPAATVPQLVVPPGRAEQVRRTTAVFPRRARTAFRTAPKPTSTAEEARARSARTA